MENGLLGALLLGVLLGIRHALDADHVVAVSTIVSEYRNPFRALWVGTSWGLGHTTSLAVAGLAILALGLALPERLSLFFELAVGVMLIFLGLQVLWSFRRRKVHWHPHLHDDSHAHFHAHQSSTGHEGHHLFRVGKPFFRVKSYVIGVVHGLAGSAALMLLAVAAMDSFWGGLSYILLFGLGSIAAMGVITIFLSFPFTTTARVPAFHRMVQSIAGSASILFGAFLIYETGSSGGLL